jgi:hypothetical protein
MENFNAIYADIGLFNQALVGKWVFHGDYMFSQEGVLGYYTNENGEQITLAVPSETGFLRRSGTKCSYSELSEIYVPMLGQTEYTSIVKNMLL